MKKENVGSHHVGVAAEAIGQLNSLGAASMYRFSMVGISRNMTDRCKCPLGEVRRGAQTGFYCQKSPSDFSDQAKGRGCTMLYEKYAWGARARGAGTTEEVPAAWSFSASRIEQLLREGAPFKVSA